MCKIFQLKINKIFYLLIVLFIFSSLSFAQSKEKKSISEIADDYTTKLERKVLLSNNQKANVKELLSVFIKDVKDGNNFAKAKDGIESKIVSLLNDKQTAKFDILKNDWWNSLNNEIRKNLR